jgi:hypothetical protein
MARGYRGETARERKERGDARGLGKQEERGKMCEQKEPHDFQDRSARHDSLIVQIRKYKKQWGMHAGEDSLLRALLLSRLSRIFGSW